MQLKQAMSALQQAGTAQNRKVYARHGAGENQFGVSFATLKALAKHIKSDHALAEQLWATGNYDARNLALMIADPRATSSRQLDQWVKDLDNYGMAMSLAGFAARTAFAQAKAEKWTPAKGEYVGQCGWDLVCNLAMNDTTLPDAYFESHLQTIEWEIHSRKNRVRHSMNNAVIAIGMRNEDLMNQALAAAARIGKVEVDHGETGCKTPDAIEYIKKAVARKKKR
jgi:3-methyladenine DNA glycosylase AlkD